MTRPDLTILSVYNRYLNRGGEDEVFAAETALLADHGGRVLRITKAGHRPGSWGRQLTFAGRAIWSKRWARIFQRLLGKYHPDLVHVHNWFPSLSPAIYYACQGAGVPVVQTLHNYRLLCPAAILFRDGHVCEDCLGKPVPWPGAWHACYHDSRAQTAGVAAVLACHNGLQTWQRTVDRYICLTEFARQKFIAGHLPADRIVVKPNFVTPDPGPGRGEGRFALFVGRLALPKGVSVLLDAWRQFRPPLPLKIVGDGPLAATVAAAACDDRAIEFLGRQDHSRVIELMQAATVLVFPSTWYETFGLAIIEAFAVGLPVIASNLGSMSELVRHQDNGLLFRAGDPADLAAQVAWAVAHPTELHRLRQSARAEFERKYTAAANYAMLRGIYRDVLARPGARP